ncbi:MAG: AAA family ATPase [Clostridia bacterium]|nr:AAA family ATPase [Clostridia bacterium]
MSRIIAIANQKGGVGKTTTAVNLSAALGKLGKKTLLIDSDPQGNATSGAGVEKRRCEKTVYDVYISEEDIENVIVETAYENFDVCPANISLSGAEIELVSMMGRENRLKNAVNAIRDKYDFIIIDAPPSLGLLTINTLTAADTVLVPIQCEYYALEGVSQLTNTISRIKQVLNPDLSLEGILMTMFDSRTNLSIQVVEEVKKFFPGQLCKTLIPRNVRLSEAPSFGQPISKYDPNSKGAIAYDELAKEIAAKGGGS